VAVHGSARRAIAPDSPEQLFLGEHAGGVRCTNTVRLAAPASERTTVHAKISLRLHATDTAGTPVTYGATGLPPGLKLNTATGLISGRPTRTGRDTVQLRAWDNQESRASAALVWTGGAPRISRLSLMQTARGGADLAFTVTGPRRAGA
jgi:hypothetical protein